VSISNLEDSGIEENTPQPDQQIENTIDKTGLGPPTYRVNQTNIQMVQNIIEQEKNEKGSFNGTNV
jgi:AMMECR1 domain-containing protein